MLTKWFECVDPENQQDAITEAANLLKEGQVVAFPTETVYGLGANALNPEAVARIYEAKGRPSRNPIIVHVASASAAQEIAANWPPAALSLAEAFWPGPLTLVLPRHSCIPDIVTGGGNTVGIRVPAHPVARALLTALDCPIAAPSANRSNHISPTRAEHVAADLAGRIPLILDGGPCKGGLESTVISLVTPIPLLLRLGLIEPEQIEQVIGPILISSTNISSSATLPSPGMMSRHYAPETTLLLTEDDQIETLLALLRQRGGNPTHLELPDDHETCAAHLYEILREADASGATHIVTSLPPAEGRWMAVRDRLLRAATPGQDL